MMDMLNEETTTTRYLMENIGPGPNSLAALAVDGALTLREEEHLRELLRWEEGTQIEAIARWLAATRDVGLRLAGAHHDVEVFDEPEDTGPVSACLFCGGDYAWQVRCPRNRDGDV